VVLARLERLRSVKNLWLRAMPAESIESAGQV